MYRFSFCEWMPMLPWPIWPLAGHARLGQNTVVGSMTILLSWLCWGACQEEVCLDPRFLCNLTLPRLSVELPSLFHLLINKNYLITLLCVLTLSPLFNSCCFYKNSYLSFIERDAS